MKKFWLLLIHGKSTPVGQCQTYDSAASACKEAARLAKEERLPVTVLEAIWHVEFEIPEPLLKWTELKKEGKDAETKEDWEDY